MIKGKKICLSVFFIINFFYSDKEESVKIMEIRRRLKEEAGGGSVENISLPKYSQLFKLSKESLGSMALDLDSAS